MISSLELMQRVLNCIRAYQRAYRYVDSARNSGLQSVEVHLLILIEGNPGLEVGAYQEWLRIPKANLSHYIGRLEELKLLACSPSLHDRRIKCLKLTRSSRSFLAKYHQEANSFVEQRLLQVPKILRASLLVWLRTLCNNLGAPDPKPPQALSPLRQQVGRLTRELQLHTTNLFGIAGLTSLRWQMLAALRDQPGLTLSQICSLLNVARASASQAAREFERHGDIDKIRTSVDRRCCALRLTDSGLKALAAFDSRALQLLKRGLGDFSNELLTKFVDGLECFSGAKMLNPSPSGKALRIVDPDELQEARYFLLGIYSCRTEQTQIPGYLLADDSYVFAYQDSERIHAVLEIRRSGSFFTTVNFAAAAASEEMRRIYFDALLHAAEDQGVKPTAESTCFPEGLPSL